MLTSSSVATQYRCHADHHSHVLEHQAAYLDQLCPATCRACHDVQDAVYKELLPSGTGPPPPGKSQLSAANGAFARPTKRRLMACGVIEEESMHVVIQAQQVVHMPTQCALGH